MSAGEALLRPVRRATLSAERFARPERDDRPGIRWWWQTPVPPSELVRELGAIAEAGFGEVEIAFSPGFWADDAQRAALTAVLAEAERLGIGVAATVGAAWPLQTPNTSRGTGLSSKELQYGVVHVDASVAGWSGVVEIPRPFDDPDGSRPATLIAVTVARVLEAGPGPQLVTVEEYFGPRVTIVGPDSSTVLALDSLEDLTDAVDDGAIAWHRTGEWAVFGHWRRECEQGVTSFLDRSAALAATRYLDEHQFGPQNLQLLRRVGTELFEDSLELNADSLFWTDDLPTRFAERFGYDVTPFLPVLFAHGMSRYWVPNEEPTADFDLDLAGAGARVRNDYYRLLTDLYVTDHLAVLQEWSAEHGLRHKAQVAYGQNLDAVRSNREFVRIGGRAEGESLNSGDRAPVDPAHPNWRFALDHQRSLVGGAHQGGATRISTELGAQFNAAFALTLGDYKQLLDKEWAAGITKPFVHGFASQEPDAPWPTQSRFFDFVAQSWNDTNHPEWANWRPLTDYWARGTVVLETGKPRTDVAVCREGFLTTAARGTAEADATTVAQLADTVSLERHGFTVQYLDPAGIAEPDAIGADGALFPDGPAYRALVVRADAVTPESAEAMDRAAIAGLRIVVVGEPPHDDWGFAGGQAGVDRVRRAIAGLLTRPTVAHLDTMSAVGDALVELGLTPRAMWSDQARLLTQWRDAGDRQFLLVYNTDRNAVQSSISVDLESEAVELDLWSGEQRPAESVVDSGRTTIPVALEALGLRMFAFSASAAPPARKPVGAANLSVVPLVQWRLEVDVVSAEGASRIELDGQGPQDWRAVPELTGASGIGRYRARTATPLSFARLSLGEISGSAIVRIGDRSFGPVYTSHAVVDLGDALQEGDEIEIEVRTSLHNAVVAGGQRPNVVGGPVATGLIGPVQLLGE